MHSKVRNENKEWVLHNVANRTGKGAATLVLNTLYNDSGKLLLEHH